MNMEQLLELPLYDALQKTDPLEYRLISAVTRFHAELEGFQELPGYTGTRLERTPHIDVPMIQRELIDAHRGNHFLDTVLAGHDTFVNIVTDLRDNRPTGLKALVSPTREIESHNNQIRHLNEILPGITPYSKKEAIFGYGAAALFFGLGASSSIVGLGTYTGLLQWLFDGTPYFKEAVQFDPRSLGRGALGTLIAAVTLFAAFTEVNYTQVLPKAEYLDRKIEEVYK